jgi:DNA-binding protein YbaB
MPDFTDLISQAKKMQEKMKETQEALKKIEVEGIAGGNAVKVIMEDLVVAAHNDAKLKLKTKTSEEISKVTGGIDLPPGFKLPF